MRVVCDIEADDLNPTQIWCVVCKEIDNDGVVHRWGPNDLGSFAIYSRLVSLWIGHNFLGYDLYALNSLVPGVRIDPRRVVDTLIVSRLMDFRRDGGHSLEAWGDSLGYPKDNFSDFSAWSQELEDRCVQDVEINYQVYLRQKDFIEDPSNRSALRTEHDIAVICHEMKTNGFYFDRQRADEILIELVKELQDLHEPLLKAFPPRARPIREVVPRATKSGSLHAGDFRWVTDGDLTPFTPGDAFTRIEWNDFNPGSPQQIVERFNDFGWKPYVKTKGHIETERELRRITRQINQTRKSLPLGKLIELREAQAKLEDKLVHHEQYGWKVNEDNLATLPATAPAAAWTLIKWRMLEKRRQTLEEWFSAYDPNDHRIHGNFNGIGTWTHRFSHSNPNMGNVPSVDSKYNSEELKEKAKYYGKLLRSLWCVPKTRRLVGVDAEGIQLRILAHYIRDNDFTNALVNGRKEDGTDVHTLNAVKLGIGAAKRPNAKTFIYAWLLGAGLDKIANIIDTDREGAERANENFLDGYPGLRQVKEIQIPEDVARGYFVGLDGRKVPCDSAHEMLAGYLQNGEALVMKRATLLWVPKLKKEKIDFKLVNYVHDEWQTEVPDDDDIANFVAETQVQSIVQAGLDLGLRCPLAGSSSFGGNWYETH